MSRIRPLLAFVIFTVVLVVAGVATATVAPEKLGQGARAHSALPDGFKPAVLRAQDSLDRYIVRMDSPAVAERERAAGGQLSAGGERRAAAAARRSQAGAIADAKALGVVDQAVADAHRREWAYVLAATVRVTRDIDVAEEVVQDAYVQALTAWARDGVPERPGAWLTTVARRLALNALRRGRTLEAKLPLLLDPDIAECPSPARSPTTACG